MYNLGEVTPRIFNSVSIKLNSPKEVFPRHFTVLRDTKLGQNKKIVFPVARPTLILGVDPSFFFHDLSTLNFFINK